jgi:hypothetical protein
MLLFRRHRVVPGCILRETQVMKSRKTLYVDSLPS